MSLYTKAADFAHRGTVLGLLAFTGFQIYQIGSYVLGGEVDSPHMKNNYMKELEAKILEEGDTYTLIPKRDLSRADDKNVLRQQWRPSMSRPEFKKQYEEERKTN